MKSFFSYAPLDFIKSKFVVCFLLVVLHISCSDKKDSKAESVKEKWRDAANETKELLDQERKDLKNEVDETISEIDNKIGKLKEKLGTKKGEGREKIRKEIDQLELKRNDLKTRMENAGDNAKETWNEFKISSRKALTEIEQKIDSIK